MNPRISSLWGVAELPGNIPWSEFDYGMVESPAEVWFLNRSDLQAEASRYTHGVAFGLRAELRWLKRRGGLYHLVYISDDGKELPGAMRQSPLTPVRDAIPERLLLWSEEDGRIPMAPEYPRGSGRRSGRMSVTLRHYEFQGRRIFRCVSLQPWKGRQ